MMATGTAENSCLMVDVESPLVVLLGRCLPVLRTGCGIYLTIGDIPRLRGIWDPRCVVRIVLVFVLSLRIHRDLPSI